MEYGMFVARNATLLSTASCATFLLLTACAKPELGGVADDVVHAVNGISENMNISLRGGFSSVEAAQCQREHLQFENLKLQTKAVVNIYISPQAVALYTESHSLLDFDSPTWYSIDLNRRVLKNYTRNWRGVWSEPTEVALPPTTNEKYFSKPDPTKVKTPLEITNPFIVPRGRLGVKLGISFFGRDSTILLNDGENYAINCAGALNAYFETLLRTEYEFKN